MSITREADETVLFMHCIRVRSSCNLFLEDLPENHRKSPGDGDVELRHGLLPIRLQGARRTLHTVDCGSSAHVDMILCC